MEFQHPSFQFQQFSFQSSSSSSSSPSSQRPVFQKNHSYDHVQHISPLSSVSDFAETSLLDVHILSQQFSLQNIRQEDNTAYQASASMSTFSSSSSSSPSDYSYSSESPSPSSSTGSSPVLSIRVPSTSTNPSHHYYHSTPRSMSNRNIHDHSFIRSQRQATSRLQTQQPHKRAIAQLVSRMVDSHEQCLTRRATAPISEIAASTSDALTPTSSSTSPSTPSTARPSFSQPRALSASSAPTTPTMKVSFAGFMATGPTDQGGDMEISGSRLEIQGSMERAVMRPRRASERQAMVSKGWVSKRIKARKGWRKQSA